MVYKLEISKERMLSALTHSGVWSLFQALLMTKYAMNLENLQPCGGGKLLSVYLSCLCACQTLLLTFCVPSFPCTAEQWPRCALSSRNAALPGYHFGKLSCFPPFAFISMSYLSFVVFFLSISRESFCSL